MLSKYPHVQGDVFRVEASASSSAVSLPQSPSSEVVSLPPSSRLRRSAESSRLITRCRFCLVLVAVAFCPINFCLYVGL